MDISWILSYGSQHFGNVEALLEKRKSLCTSDHHDSSLELSVWNWGQNNETEAWKYKDNVFDYVDCGVSL